MNQQDERFVIDIVSELKQIREILQDVSTTQKLLAQDMTAQKQQIAANRKSIKPLRRHVTLMEGALKLICVGSIVTTFLLGFLKLLGKI